MARNETWRPVETAARELAAEVRRALDELAKAEDYARRLNRDPWDFAVELASLTGLGLTTSDLRWLVGMGYIEQARDVSRPGHAARKFQPCENLTFTSKTCFVLTAAGAATLAQSASGGLSQFSFDENGTVPFRAAAIEPASAQRAMPPPPRNGMPRVASFSWASKS